MDGKKAQLSFLLVLLATAGVLAFFIFRPYVNSLALAAALAIVFRPVYKKILYFFSGQRSFSALATVLIFIVIILAPLTFFSIQIFEQSLNVYNKLTTGSNGTGVFKTIIQVVEANLKTFLPNLSIDIDLYVRQGINWVLQNIGTIFSKLANVLFGLFITMLAFYYLLKDGHKVENILIRLSPLSDKYDYAIFNRLEIAVNSVVKGSLLIALIQGILTGSGFAIFGVPNAALWGMLAVIAALIPTVGTALVLTPGVLYLLFTGNFFMAIGLAIWGVIAVGLIDNLLGPKLIERGISLHPLLILLSVLGGLKMFGPIGFILGPIILSFLFAVLDIYKQEFKNLLTHNS